MGIGDGASSGSGVIGLVSETFVGVNLGFFAFNMLPIPPLDGSRVLYALAPEFVQRGMEAIERFGILFVFALILLFNNLIFAYMSGAINLFISLFSWVFGIA